MLARALRPERDAVVLVADHVVGPGDEGDEVRRQRLGLRRTPTDAPSLDLLGPGALPMTTQSGGARDVERVRRLQVGLVEAGEDRSGAASMKDMP